MKKTFGLIIAAALLSPLAALACENGDNGNNGNCVEPPVTVPEPGTLALLALGIAGLALSRRRKP